MVSIWNRQNMLKMQSHRMTLFGKFTLSVKSVVLVHMVLSNKSNKQLILITWLKQKTNQQQQQKKPTNSIHPIKACLLSEIHKPSITQVLIRNQHSFQMSCCSSIMILETNLIYYLLTKMAFLNCPMKTKRESFLFITRT